jgi:benzoyl-CoA reductase/2-hydroxyglutaryl-CoA dehydratase subunit BcrC/BadD/HgdB
MSFSDPVPARITFPEWGRLFEQIPTGLIQQYHYFRNQQPKCGNPVEHPEPRNSVICNLQPVICNPPSSEPYPWSTYLFPPQTFAVYGSRHLRRLKFDNSLAALRMWGFVMNETERLFRARQIGKRVIATMGDLGGTPPMVLAAGNTVPFYPDCIWWVPFTNESTVLFDAAAAMGIGESACYSRAALGAFAKRSYFPDPVLCIGATGASCDDYSSVEQLVAGMGYSVFWFELPLRKDADSRSGEAFARTPAGTEYQSAARVLLVSQFERLRRELSKVLGCEIGEAALKASIRQVNVVRRRMRRIREKVHGAEAMVFPALEMMVLEFGNLHFYSDISEWQAILEHIEQTIDRRLTRRDYLGSPDALRVVWVTPPADPLLLVFAEDLGLRVVGTEYVINQALHEIAEDREPITALAENLLNASLIGSSRARAQSVIDQARQYKAEGIVISGILGGSHCAFETSLIQEYVARELDLPVLAFDVPAPAPAVSSQVRTRLEAFVELLRARRE